MISGRDIYATAKLMITRHGQGAALQAENRADELRAGGDLDGQRVWQSIINAIEEMQRDKPVEDESVH